MDKESITENIQSYPTAMETKIEAQRERTPRIKQQPVGAEAVSDEAHTGWVRDDPADIRKMQNRGFRMAKESDVATNHDGYKQNDIIRNGDLVLMVGKREEVEAKQRKYEADQHAMDNAIKASDKDETNAFGANAGHSAGGSGTKTFNIPWEPK